MPPSPPPPPPPRANCQVLRRVFRSAPVGGPRSRSHATRAEFREGLALLGLPQSLTSVQLRAAAAASTPSADAPLPGAPSAPRPKPQQSAVESDAAIDAAIVDALFDKYAEKPGVRLLEPQARAAQASTDKVLDYSTLYERVSKAAIRPGNHRAPSIAMAEAAYRAKLHGHGHGASTGGGIFDARRSALSQQRWAQSRGAAGDTRRPGP